MASTRLESLLIEALPEFDVFLPPLVYLDLLSSSRVLYSQRHRLDVLSNSLFSTLHFIRAVIDGKRNVLLTGLAGTGKSYSLAALIKVLEKRNTSYAITASTGSAAVLLGMGATTVHSFSKLGYAKEPLSLMCEKLGVEMDHRLLRDENQDAKVQLQSSEVRNGKLDWTEQKLAEKEKHRLRNTYSKAFSHLKVLVVEEVSMMGAYFLEKLDLVLRVGTGNLKQRMGGIQLVLLGDFKQLPPIHEPFCFKSPLWNDCNFVPIIKRHPFRQSRDLSFWNTIVRLSDGSPTEEDFKLLDSCIRSFNSNSSPSGTLNCDLQLVGSKGKPVFIFPRNDQVDELNEFEFRQIRCDPKDIKVVRAYDYIAEQVERRNQWIDDGRYKGLLKQFSLCSENLEKANAYFVHNSPPEIFLKPTAQYVLTKNFFSLHPQLNNGAVCFYEIPKKRKNETKDSYCKKQRTTVDGEVQFSKAESEIAGQEDDKDTEEEKDDGPDVPSFFFPRIGKRFAINQFYAPSEMFLGMNGAKKIVYRRNQLAVRLGYATTPHKSQGATFKEIQADLGPKASTPGLAYVVISRCETSEGLFLSNFDRKAIKADPEVTEFYKQLEEIEKEGEYH